MLSLHCAICGSKKSRFIKEQKTEDLNSLGIKIPILIKLPLADNNLF